MHQKIITPFILLGANKIYTDKIESVNKKESKKQKRHVG